MNQHQPWTIQANGTVILRGNGKALLTIDTAKPDQVQQAIARLAETEIGDLATLLERFHQELREGLTPRGFTQIQGFQAIIEQTAQEKNIVKGSITNATRCWL